LLQCVRNLWGHLRPHRLGLLLVSLCFLALLLHFCGEILVQVLRMRPYIYLHGRPMDRRSVEARRDLELESQGTMITAHRSQAAHQVLQGQRQVALG
jgi:hypothetical protein